MIDLRRGLDKLEEEDLHRSLRTLQSSPSARVKIDGREVVNFASNNYLALAEDARLARAAKEAVDRWGAGATASRLLGGSLDVHAQLEREIAAFKRTEAAAAFPSGYHANLGALPALLEPSDTVLLDRLCHASLVDGARLGPARLKVFRHNDLDDLEKALKRIPAGTCWIVTESVFSMDGDAAPLRGIAALARRHGARVYVDEAHATGVAGPDGRGLVNALGLEREIDVCMGTFSKALGSAGGYVCGSRELVEWIHNRCRSFIYSTALPPASAAAARAAIDVCLRDGSRREKVLRLAARLREKLGLPAAPVETAIVPFVVGGEKAALEASGRLWDAGFFVPAIRPPTVPRGTARLRFSVTAGHSEREIDAAAEIVSGKRAAHAG